MKKYRVTILMGLLMCMITMTCSAQLATQEQDISERAHLKVLGGFSYSTFEGRMGAFGPMVGTRFDVRVSSRPVYVGAGVEYMNRGYHRNPNHSLVVPFLGSYHLSFGGGVNLEPYAGTVFCYGINWSAFDAGVRLGCNLKVNRWDFNLGYDLGFRYYKFEEASGRNQTILFSVGYNFNIK